MVTVLSGYPTNSININRYITSLLKTRFSDNDINLLKDYLKERVIKRKKYKYTLSIVYDVTDQCNLSCKGCAVNPKFVDTFDPLSHPTPPYNLVEKIIKKNWRILYKGS